MSTEANQALMRRAVDEIWNQGKLDVVDEVLAPDYLEHNPRVGQASGLEGYREGVRLLRHAFPALQLTIENIMAADDQVAVRYTMRGTQQGEFMGIPPTGKAIAITGMVMARIKDGKVVERAGNQDEVAMLTQLGVMPQAKHIVVNDDEFGRRIVFEVKEKFRELYKNKPGEEFVQAKISLEFIVTARKKKPKPSEDPEPCCVCFRAGDGFICTGECCSDILLPEIAA